MYFQNSIGFSNQRNFFYYLMTMRIVIDQSVFAFLLVIKMGVGNRSKKKNIMDLFHMFNKELHLKMVLFFQVVFFFIVNSLNEITIYF